MNFVEEFVKAPIKQLNMIQEVPNKWRHPIKYFIYQRLMARKRRKAIELASQVGFYFAAQCVASKKLTPDQKARILW